MKNIKLPLLLLATLCLLLPTTLFGFGSAFMVMQGGVEGVSEGSSGRIGVATTASNTGTGEYPTMNRTFHSDFTTETAGDVSYIYLDLALNSTKMGHIRPAIWDSSGDLVSEATSCSGTNVTGTTYRYPITSTTLTAATTYKLGFTSGTGGEMQYVSSGSGTIYADTTSYTSDTCPAGVEDPIEENVDYGTIYSFTGTIKVWASDADDNY